VATTLRMTATEATWTGLELPLVVVVAAALPRLYAVVTGGAEPRGGEHGAAGDDRVQPRQRGGDHDDQRKLEPGPGGPGRRHPQRGGDARDDESGGDEREIEPAAAASVGRLTGSGAQPQGEYGGPEQDEGRDAVATADDEGRRPVQDSRREPARQGMQAGKGSQHPGDAEVGEAFGLTGGEVAHACSVGRRGRVLTPIADVSATTAGPRPASAARTWRANRRATADDGVVPSLNLRREIAVRGPQQPDEVWDRYVRPVRWRQWSPQITGVDYEPRRLVPGTTGVVRGPLRVPVPFEVLAVDESDPSRRVWRWRAGTMFLHVELEHVVEPAPPPRHGTRTRLVLSGPARIVIPYLPLAWVAPHRLVR